MGDPLPPRSAEALPRVLLPALETATASARDEVSDNDLMASLADSSRTAAERQALFEQLYRRYAEPLLSFLTRFTPDRSLQDDISQDAWLKVLTKAETYQPKNFRAWLFTIAANLYLTKRRKGSKEAALDDQAATLPDLRGIDALDELSRAEDYAQLQQCVERLPEQYRQVVRGRLADNDSQTITNYLKIPVERCYRLFHAAKQLLLDCIEKHRT